MLLRRALLAGLAAWAALQFPARALPSPRGEPNLAIRSVQQEDDPPMLTVRGAQVIFFGPSRAEADSVARQEGLEVYDVLDDFNETTGKVGLYLRRKGIGVAYTTSPLIIVELTQKGARTIDRRTSGFVGLILTDGTGELRSYPGIGTERELITEIQNFFHIP